MVRGRAESPRGRTSPGIRANPRGVMQKGSLRGLGRKKPTETASRGRTVQTLATCYRVLVLEPSVETRSGLPYQPQGSGTGVLEMPARWLVCRDFLNLEVGDYIRTWPEG